MPNKPTDNEIKKALEYCSKQGITSECEKCKMPKNTCRTELIGYAFDLINRLQAENENLSHNNRQMTRDIMGLHKALETAKAENERLTKAKELVEGAKCVYSYDGETLEYCVHSPCPISKTVDQIKAEAYKECIEKVKEKSKKTEVVCSGALVTMSYAISNKNLDNLLKELVGDNK